MGPPLADPEPRDGGAERCPDPAGPQRSTVALARLAHAAHGLRDVARGVLNTATPHDAHTPYRRHTGPGLGAILSLVRLDDLHARPRCPRVHAGVSSGRFGTGAKASAGKRSGTAGPTRGPAALTWAFAAAAVRVWRAQPAGQMSRSRVATKHRQATAWTVLAHQCARAVSALVQPTTACALPTFRRGSGRVADAPDASRATSGVRLTRALWHARDPASVTAQEPRGVSPRARRGEWPPASAACQAARASTQVTCAAPPPSLALTGEPDPCCHRVA